MARGDKVLREGFEEMQAAKGDETCQQRVMRNCLKQCKLITDPEDRASCVSFKCPNRVAAECG